MPRLIHISLITSALLWVVTGCGGGDRQAPADAQQPAAVEQPAPAQPPAAAPAAEPAPQPKAVRKQVSARTQEGPAAPVLINGVMTNGDAAIISDFQRRVNAYLDLKKSVDKKTPDQKETHDPIRIETTQKLLAAKIKNVRSGAQQGDIFTPDIQAKFRQLLTPEVKGTTGRETKQEVTEDFAEGGKEAGNPRAALRVNVEYPEGTPLATTPANLLMALPKLPDGLEYRFVGKNLLIRDADANLVVDFMPAAIR